METHNLIELETQLQTALTLKADDLLFTVGGKEGSRVQDAFLGVPCHGDLATDVFLDAESLATIDLNRFQIADQVRRLYEMLESKSLSLRPKSHWPDHHIIRQDALEFFEHFLSTLPRVALGGWDATSVRNGALRHFYDDCVAWTNLVESIEEAFSDEGNLYNLRVADLARLSDVEVRTMRNRVGPQKPIRTTPERRQREGKLGDGAFVGVNTLDALNWLAERPRFTISTIDPAWVEERMAAASQTSTVGRSAVSLGLVNVGSLAKMAEELRWAEEKVQQWAESGPSDNASEAAALAELVGINPETYAARCAA